MTRNANKTGFTLIEMLIALAIMATIASMVYGSYAATSQSVEAYSSRLSYSERASLVLRLMARQIRCAYIPAPDPNAIAAEVRTPSNGHFPTGLIRSEPVFYGNARAPHGNMLKFATTTGLGGGPKEQHALSVVAYRYDRITQTFWIHSRPYVNQLHRTDHAKNEHAILDHVTAVNVEFYDGHRWQSQWSETKKHALPRAVRIDLELVDERERSYHFGTTVAIQSQFAPAPAVSTRKVKGDRL